MAFKMKMYGRRKISFHSYFSNEDIKLIQLILELALEEDITDGDITTQSTVDNKQEAIAYLRAKQNGVIAGLPLMEMILKQKTKKYKLHLKVGEGDTVRKNQVVAEIISNARVLLMTERTLLNFLQRLSGIATLTRQYVNAVKKYPVRIMDTRKTTPLLRILEKYAVAIGGGRNHRFGLFDQILIKDNHIELSGGIEEAVKRVRKKYPGEFIEVEAKTLEQVKRIISFRPEVILLDNMTIQQLRKAVSIVQGKAKLEASGGVNLKTVSKIASTGIDYISVGALTHSAPSLDLSLKMIPLRKNKKR